MYGLAHVILNQKHSSLQDELDATLAAFKRGDDKDFPREKLAFDNETPYLERLHRCHVRASADGSISWPADFDFAVSFELDPRKLNEHLAACRLEIFEGQLNELEPDFEAFVRRFTKFNSRDPDTGLYGRWLNPLGMWDWWELGGRFNGMITGERRPAASTQHVSSGPSGGRDVLGNIVSALGAELSDARAEIELNVELVETLRQNLSAGVGARLPMAIVLPHGCGPDAARWFDNLEWHEVAQETRDLLGVSGPVGFRDLLKVAYERFSAHAVAGVAYHF
jgi:hypothetical protein